MEEKIDKLRDEFVKETGITIIDEGDYTAWLEDTVLDLRYELEQTQAMLRQAEDAAGNYEKQCNDMERELKHIYDRPNINHP